MRRLNSRIAELMRNGLVEDAQKIFDANPQRNTVTWNSMIRGYFRNRQFRRAVHLFQHIPERDVFSYNTMITGLMHSGDVVGASRVFNHMPVRDLVSWNAMIAGCVRNSCVNQAVVLFDGMPERNVISWNLMIGGFLDVGSFALAERVFHEMPDRDAASWTIMVTALSGVGRVEEARELFDKMPERDDLAWNAILACYAQNNRIQIAEALFWKTPYRCWYSHLWKEMIAGFVRHGWFGKAMGMFVEMSEKDTCSWNPILLGLIRNNHVEAAHALFLKTPFKDIISWTNLIVGYFESTNVDIGFKLFRSIMAHSDTAVWNATIFGLGENDHGEEGLKLFMEMKLLKEEGDMVIISPDEATLTSVLNICSSLPSLDFGKQTHGQVIKYGFDWYCAVGNATITMYARCGSICCAHMTFSNMFVHNRVDTISWNSMISGFSQHGNIAEALDLFHGMRASNFKPDEITFIAILSGCSHSGWIEEGRYYFDRMVYKYFMKPTSEHYSCIIDLYGRLGFIDEAVELVDRMMRHDDGVAVWGGVWGSLLGACRMYQNLKVGEMVGWRVLEMEPWNAGAYLILAEMYVVGGRRRDAERLWELMKERGVKKQPGCSWIDINNCVHVFLADAINVSSHPNIYGIHCMLLLLETAQLDCTLLNEHCISEIT